MLHKHTRRVTHARPRVRKNNNSQTHLNKFIETVGVIRLFASH